VNPEEGSIAFLRNVITYLPNYMASRNGLRDGKVLDLYSGLVRTSAGTQTILTEVSRGCTQAFQQMLG
jgi:hypothetical protein